MQELVTLQLLTAAAAAVTSSCCMQSCKLDFKMASSSNALKFLVCLALLVCACHGAVVFKMTHNIGFGSTFVHLLQAYIYAETNQLEFYIDSSAWGPGRWRSLFDSLEEWDMQQHTGKEVLVTGHRNNYYTHIFEIFYTAQQYETAIHVVFRPSFPIPHLDTDCCAVQVRRGDKQIEARRLSGQEIAAFIPRVPNVLFVMSDDYRVVKEMQSCFPDRPIKTLTPDTSMGSEEKFYNNYNGTQMRQRFILLISEMMMYTQCSIQYSDVTSNLGRTLKLLSFHKTVMYTTDPYTHDKLIRPMSMP